VATPEAVCASILQTLRNVESLAGGDTPEAIFARLAHS
jgi:hypothetical protein